MKPSKLVPFAIMCVALGLAWTYTLLYKIDWYVSHLHNNVLTGIFIILALLILFSGLILILSIFE